MLQSYFKTSLQNKSAPLIIYSDNKLIQIYVTFNTCKSPLLGGPSKLSFILTAYSNHPTPISQRTNVTQIFNSKTVNLLASQAKLVNVHTVQKFWFVW